MMKLLYIQASPRGAASRLIRTGSGTFRSTGKPMCVVCAHPWRLPEGRIARFDMYTDTLLIARAMI
jgi:ketosteroid isomerase-like protein